MTWITTPPKHRCDLPSTEGRREGEWWICPECNLGHPVEEWEGVASFGIACERSTWMFHTREARPKRWWGR